MSDSGKPMGYCSHNSDPSRCAVCLRAEVAKLRVGYAGHEKALSLFAAEVEKLRAENATLRASLDLDMRLHSSNAAELVRRAAELEGWVAEARKLLEGSSLIFCQHGIVISSEDSAVLVGSPCPHCGWMKKTAHLEGKS